MRPAAMASILAVLCLSGPWGSAAHGQQADQAAVGKAISPDLIVGAPEGDPLSGAELDRQTNEVASLMRCPVCQALSVADSPTDSAIAMREEARALLAAGYTQPQVLTYFEKAYGEFILLEPKKKGFNLTVWLAPLAFLLIGAFLVARRLRGGSVVTPAPAASSGDDDLARYAERVRREVSS